MSEFKELRVMDRNAILATFRELAKSQGFYGRLLNYLEELKEQDSEAYEAKMQELEDQKFHDSLDLVLYLET